MSRLFQFFAAAGTVLGFCGPAHAHLGHMGELAGHSHWIGIAAIATAAALGVLVLRPIKENADSEAEADNDSEGESDDEPVS